MRSFPLRFLAIALFLLTPLACTIDNETTEIQFDETDNIGVTCDQVANFSWTVFERATGEQATAGCQQPIRFTNLSDRAVYTFDITAYTGSTLCLQGSCAVQAEGGTRIYAHCASQVVRVSNSPLCTF